MLRRALEGSRLTRVQLQLRSQQPWLAAVRLRQAARRGRQAGPQRVAAAARDPYDLLGVPRTANVADIKKAYRKRALKLHPDVNKAPDARERFMEAKQAYQQLLDEKEGRGGARGGASGASSTPGGSSAGSGAGGWGSRGGAGSYGQGPSRPSGQQQQRWQPPEPDYTFGDLLRDLDKELSSFTAERQKKRGAAAGAAPKSLWEELADIGEEFVEFLEQSTGVSDEEAASSSASKKEYGEFGGAGAGSPTTSGPTSGTGPSMSSAFGSGARPASSGATGGGTRSSASSTGSSSSSSSSGGGGAKPGAPPLQRQSTAEYVEEELEALKRKLGKK